MRKKIYRSAVLATVISCIAMALFAWYAVGIIEKSNTEDTLEKRVDQVVKMLDRRQDEYNTVTEQIYSDYKSKARAMAILLSEDRELLENESKFEEFRVISGAEVITVTDQYMKAKYTTGTTGEEPEIYSEFSEAVNSKVFSDVIIDKEDDTFKIVAASSRLDKKGVVQIEFMSRNVESFLDFTNISNFLTDVPVMKTGCLGIIDKETMNYIGHTQKNMTDQPSYFDLKKDFSKDKGGFIDCAIGGEDVLLRYAFCQAGVVVGYIPYSEVYETRNDTAFWVVLAAVIIAAVVILVIRNRIRISRKQK